ncbi:MAG: RNA-binding protein [Gammaproteobacteria bacterium]|nr:RNA-binding protein [Gammaproteobacteria bacterium]MDH3507216.1 RNA-binding protein [Gammaproteobacteria bacterium]
MSKKLHVGNLPSSATKEELSNRFGKFGIVELADVIRDTRTGQRRCSGLVEMACEANAQAAMKGLNFTQYGDLTISVSAAPAKAVV